MVQQLNAPFYRAYRFHSARALIVLAMLTLSDLCPPLPDRAE